MLEYPSRSNLNCFNKFYSAPAGGEKFFNPRKVSTPLPLENVIIIVGVVGFEPTQHYAKVLQTSPALQLRRTPKLKLSRGEPIFHFLLDSCSLLTIVHTVTTREPNLIFVPREGIEPPPFPCKRNTLPLRHRGKYTFLLDRLSVKPISYPRQELNLTPLVKSQLPTPVCYEG